MKKTLSMLAIVMLAGTFAAKAQIQRGNVMVGGDISNFQLSLNKGGAFNMRIDPKAAWFIKDNLALGAYVDFELRTGNHAGSYTQYGVGALARSYMNGNAVAAVRHTRLFIEANVGIQGTNDNQSIPKVSTNGLGLGIGPGLAYFITPNIGLEGLLKYNGIIGFGTTTTNSYLNLGVGFQVYLPGGAVRRAATNSQ